MQLPYHLLGLAQGPSGDNLFAVNFDGAMLHFKDASSNTDPMPSFAEKRHNYLISDMLPFGPFIALGSENKVFFFNAEDPSQYHSFEDLPNKEKITGLYANSHSLYATTLDKHVLRFTIDGPKFANSLDLKSAAGKAIGVGEDVIYVLRSNGEIDEVDAVALTVKRTHKHTIDATCMAYSQQSKELWIGDKKGSLHVLSAADFSAVHKIDKHTKTVTCITASPDGSMIASGDGYRYQYVWDASSRAVKGEYGF